jgi:hypothetical protein
MQEFERMGEMTKTAVSSIEMKFADLVAKIEGCVPMVVVVHID